MKPVAILRFTPTEGPGYFSQFLEQHHLPWRLIAIDAGMNIPTADEFSGLVLMGGPMSVNDPLPWIEQVCHLIRQAVTEDIPVLGHCLGGQLISKALGGKITRNPVKEIGWSVGNPVSTTTATQWLDALSNQQVPLFQWHGETFSLPEGAERIFQTDACQNQAFALGPHLGMQCHIEMTEEMIHTWNTQWADECSVMPSIPSIQTPTQMNALTPEKLPKLREVANQLYGQWIKGLRR